MLQKYGVTNKPNLCVWVLRDGTMINGSYEGYQRDIDHRCIGEFFKRSKFDNYNPMLYIRKFMRRGNIRYSFDMSGLCAEIAGPPSKEQFRKMSEHAKLARSLNLEACIGRLTRNGRVKYEDWRDYLSYLNRYTSLIPSDKYRC